MRALLQRVSDAKVEVEGEITGQIGLGILVLLGVARDDTEADADYLVEKILHLRIFPDDEGRMNRSVLEVGGSLLVVSQFTLYGDCQKGRRPSFEQAASASVAKDLYEHFVESARNRGATVETGAFQAEMKVSLTNAGPVTLMCDSR